MAVSLTLKEAVERQSLRITFTDPAQPDADLEPTDDEPPQGGRLDEVQSLVWHWSLSPEEACEIVEFPLNRFVPWDDDRGEPNYLPSHREIERLSQRMRSGELVIGCFASKLFIVAPDEDDVDVDLPE